MGLELEVSWPSSQKPQWEPGHGLHPELTLPKVSVYVFLAQSPTALTNFSHLTRSGGASGGTGRPQNEFGGCTMKAIYRTHLTPVMQEQVCYHC